MRVMAQTNIDRKLSDTIRKTADTLRVMLIPANIINTSATVDIGSRKSLNVSTFTDIYDLTIEQKNMKNGLRNWICQTFISFYTEQL